MTDTKIHRLDDHYVFNELGGVTAGEIRAIFAEVLGRANKTAEHPVAKDVEPCAVNTQRPFPATAAHSAREQTPSINQLPSYEEYARIDECRRRIATRKRYS